MSKKAFEKKNSSGLKIFCIFAIELLQKSRNEKKRNMENPFKFGTIVDSYSLGGGIGEDCLYPISTTTTAASTFIHETLDELLNRNLLGNVTRESAGIEKVKYQNIAQRILNRTERNGNDHQY